MFVSKQPSAGVFCFIQDKIQTPKMKQQTTKPWERNRWRWFTPSTILHGLHLYFHCKLRTPCNCQTPSMLENHTLWKTRITRTYPTQADRYTSNSLGTAERLFPSPAGFCHEMLSNLSHRHPLLCESPDYLELKFNFYFSFRNMQQKWK